jgi:mono/diheme cytochrome c family protein
MLSQGITAAAGDASRGKGMFEMACASCHGKNGKGTVQAPGIDFTTAVWQSKYRDGQIASIIKAGRPPKMPPVNLSDEELRDIIAYVRTLKVKAPKKKISY